MQEKDKNILVQNAPNPNKKGNAEKKVLNNFVYSASKYPNLGMRNPGVDFINICSFERDEKLSM